MDTYRQKYQLIDYVDDYGTVGYYETLEEAHEAIESWIIDTDGECRLHLKEWDERLGAYISIPID